MLLLICAIKADRWKMASQSVTLSIPTNREPPPIQDEILISPRGSKNPVYAKVDYIPVPDKKDQHKYRYIMSKCVREVSMNVGLGVRFELYKMRTYRP